MARRRPIHSYLYELGLPISGQLFARRYSPSRSKAGSLILLMSKPMKTLASIVFCTFAFGIASAQDAFIFRPGQSVYIVAVQGNLGDPSLSALDLAAEREIRDGFAKRATFSVAPSLSKADFVFFCVTEYKPNVKAKVLLNVLVLALKPADFESNRADLIKLRDSALWQSTRSARIKVKFKSVMEDFHDFAQKK